MATEEELMAKLTKISDQYRRVRAQLEDLREKNRQNSRSK